jgi:hypothetical protein
MGAFVVSFDRREEFGKQPLGRVDCPWRHAPRGSERRLAPSGCSVGYRSLS